MKERTFTIPKTTKSNKDVLVREKLDSRNVTDLFVELKSSSFDVQFDFRQIRCQSCDTIHNSDLQKFYNDRRIEMRKDNKLIECFAFHTVCQRENALNIAKNGLNCQQLAFNIDKFLGDPKDGIHLSRRPDLLLRFCHSKGLKFIGLVVFKVLLGKGFGTIPSEKNVEFSGQFHYDHHFSKLQPTTNENESIRENFSKTLIFCYEHKEFDIVSRPRQILPIAVLWFDLVDFASRTSTSSKRSNEIVVSIPRTSLYTSFSNERDDPRLNRRIELIIASPQKSTFSTTTNINVVEIPLISNDLLVDPRRLTTKENRKICFLDSRALHHAVEQQKRLNSYCQSVDRSIVRTSYNLIPLIEHIERIDRSFNVLVADCFQFGFQTNENDDFIDLNNDVNRCAFQQIEISNNLAAEKNRIHAQEMKLKLREKKQRKLQDDFEQQTKFHLDPIRSKHYIQTGRNCLKHRRLLSTFQPNLTDEILNFFSHEYQNETRTEVKRLLAELMGVFIEKYPKNIDQTTHKIVDMDVDPPINDCDERFPVVFAPPPPLPPLPPPPPPPPAILLLPIQNTCDESMFRRANSTSNLLPTFSPQTQLNSSSSYPFVNNSKTSEAIERLQMFLQTHSNSLN